MIKSFAISTAAFMLSPVRKRKAMTESERLSQIWRQLRDYGSVRGFEMDYKFLRSCAHYVGATK